MDTVCPLTQTGASCQRRAGTAERVAARESHAVGRGEVEITVNRRRKEDSTSRREDSPGSLLRRSGGSRVWGDSASEVCSRADECTEAASKKKGRVKGEIRRMGFGFSGADSTRGVNVRRIGCRTYKTG